MSAAELVETLAAKGVELWFEGDRLRFRAPKNVLTAEQRAELSAMKADILTHLRGQAERATTVWPLSFSQRSLWFVNRQAPESAAYNVGFAARIVSPVEVAALRQALQALCDRHASLRTTFPIVDGVPVQQISGTSTAVLELHDVEGEDETRLHDRVMADYRRPFDLEHGPVLRTALYSRAPQEHVFLLAVHHIVADGWSLLQLLEELRALYAEATGGPAVSNARPPVEYAQFTQWQADMLAGDEGKRLANYWRTQMASPRVELEVPADRPRPPRRSTRGGTFPVDLGEAASARVRQLAKDEGTTLFVVLLAAFKTLLYRYTGTNDVVVGTPTFGRSRPEFARVIGDFVNTIPLRSQIDPDLTFSDLVGRLKKTVFDALGAQDYPLPLLVEQLQPVRDSSRSPLFEILFVLQRFDQLRELEPVLVAGRPDACVDFGGLKLAHYPLDQQEGQFDLTLQVIDRSGPLALQFKFNLDLFDEQTIAGLSRHFRVLLEAVTTEPKQTLGRAPLLAEAERAELLGHDTTTAVAAQPATTLHGRFEAQVRRAPDAVAATCDGLHLTYADLNRRANRLARRLRDLGVGRDTLVGLYTERSLDLVVAILGILKAGGAYVPIDLAYPADRVAFMLADAAAPVLVTQRGLCDRLPAHGAVTVFVDDDLTGYPDTDPPLLTEPDDLAYMIYTSGSTGKPKGTMLTHRAVDRLFTSTDAWYRFDAHDVWTLFHSVAFDFSVWELWGALLYGGRVVVVPFMVSRSPEAFLELLHDEGVTVLNQTPSAFLQLIQAEGAAGAPRRTPLRYVIFGGEALELQSLRPWFDRHGDTTPTLVNMYGITETCVHVTYRHITLADLDACAGSVIGVPIPDLRVHVLDAQKEPVPRGVPGEMYVGGPGLARGYLNRPDLTDERFVADPFVLGERLYRTGDLARRRAGGDLEYLGRIDQQVKIRGFRIELGEIEAVIAQVAGVREKVVVVREDTPDNRRLVAYIVCDGDEAAVLESVRKNLGAALPEYMLPAAFVLIDRLPLTNNGKVDRDALPAPGGADVMATGDYVAPATETEKAVAGIFCEVLGLAAVGVHQSFFEVGGHSLLATRLVARLRQHFEIEVPLIALFRTPTPESLSRWIDAEAGKDALPAPSPEAQVNQLRAWKCLVPTPSSGSRPPLFLITGYMFADDTLGILSNLIAHIGADQPLCGVRPRWLDGQSPQYSSVAEMAEEYLADVRAFQPRGPYYLLGDCVGGVVAVEMAQRLIAQGEEVALLVLLDTERPRFFSFVMGEVLRLKDRMKHIAGILQQFRRPAQGTRLQVVADVLQRKLRRARLSGTPITTAEHIFEQRTAYQRLLKRHRLKRYPGHIKLIVAEDIYRFVRFLGWTGFADKGLEVIRTPGEHQTFRAQYSREFGQLLRRCIDAAQSESEQRKVDKANHALHDEGPKRKGSRLSRSSDLLASLSENIWRVIM